MKKHLLAFLALPVLALGAIHSETPYQFTVTQEDYTFSSEFHMSSPDSYDAVAKKSSFRLRTNYDLSDENGWQATGIKRFLSLGSLYTWATEIDIYDTRGHKLGMIDGQVATTEEAKFSFYAYDDEGNSKRVGVAYLDREMDTYCIYPEDGMLVPLIQMDRVFVPNAPDYWNVKVLNPKAIDDRVVRIFAAFAIDTQGAFVPDDVPEKK